MCGGIVPGAKGGTFLIVSLSRQTGLPAMGACASKGIMTA
eukprot:gene5660-5722_t